MNRRSFENIRERAAQDIAQQFLSAFSPPTEKIPKADLAQLERAFRSGRVILGGEITLKNRHKYKCMAVGWKLLNDLHVQKEE